MTYSRGLVIVGDQRAHHWLAGVVVVPDRGGQCQTRCRMRVMTPGGVCPPWRSRSSWPLKVSLTDSTICRSGLKNRVPGRLPSPCGPGAAVPGLSGGRSPWTGRIPRGGVDYPHGVSPQDRIPCQDPAQPAHRVGQLAQPLVVARLAGQMGEQVPQMLAGKPRPAGLGDKSQQGLHHHQGHQLGVRDLRADPGSGPPRRMLLRGLRQVTPARRHACTDTLMTGHPQPGLPADVLGDRP
jgi:hypothetical protein